MLNFNSADVSLRTESRLTGHSQTTIPAAIRDALHLKPGEIIEDSLLPGGKVVMSRQQEEEHDDPMVEQFLSFLEKDMIKNPHRIQPASVALWAKVNELTAGVDVDLDAPLTGDDE